MLKKEVLEALCRICDEVRNKTSGDYEIFAADCFCGKKPNEHFKFDEEIILFIEEAIHEKLKRDDKIYSYNDFEKLISDIINKVIM